MQVGLRKIMIISDRMCILSRDKHSQDRFSDMNTEIGGRSTLSDVTDEPQVPKLPSMNFPKQEINTDRCKLN